MDKESEKGLFFIKDKNSASNHSIKKAIIPIKGMHCQSCISKIESALKKVAGVSSASVDFSSAKAIVEYDSALVSPLLLHDAIEKSGYKSEEEKHVKADNSLKKKQGMSSEVKYWLKRGTIALILAAPLLYPQVKKLIVFLPTIPLDNLVLTSIQGLVAFVIMLVGFSFYKDGFLQLFKFKPTTNSLIALGTFGVFGYSVFIVVMQHLKKEGYASSIVYFDTVGLIITIFLLYKCVESIIEDKASSTISKLIKLQPRVAILVKNKEHVQVSIDELKPGDHIVVKPQQIIPIDGYIISGYSSVDEFLITGASIPVEKTASCEVIGGSLNKTGTLIIRATNLGENSILSQIVKTVKRAQVLDSPFLKHSNKLALLVAFTSLFVAAISFGAWYFVGTPAIGLTTAFAVLLVASPRLVSLAMPSAINVGLAKAATFGVLFKDAGSIKTASKIDVLIFNSSALTKGKPKVTDVICLGKAKQDSLIQLAAIVEKKSSHSIARTIVQSARSKGLKIPKSTKFQSYPNLGVRAVYGSKNIFVGCEKFINSNKIDTSNMQNSIELLENQGKTVVFVATKKGLVGLIAIRDELKPFAVPVISALKESGLDVTMLFSGNEKTAKALAASAQISSVVHSKNLDNNNNLIGSFQSKGKIVGFVGNEINDAFELATANVGIAMGSGASIKNKTGNIVLIKNDLRDLLCAVTISKKTARKVKHNFFFAFAYNILLIPLATGILFQATGWVLSPILAFTTSVFSGLIVVSSALTLKLYKPKLSNLLPAPKA